MTAKARAKRLAKWQAAAAVIGVSAFFLIGLQQVTAPPLDLTQARTLRGHVAGVRLQTGQKVTPHLEFGVAGEPLWLLVPTDDAGRRLRDRVVRQDVEVKVVSERRGAITREVVVELRRDGELLHDVAAAQRLRARERTEGWIHLGLSSLGGLYMGWQFFRVRRANRVLEAAREQAEAELDAAGLAELRELEARSEAFDEGCYQLEELDRKVDEQRLAHVGVALCGAGFSGLFAWGGVALIAKLQPELMVSGGTLLGLGALTACGSYYSWATRVNTALLEEREALSAKLQADLDELG